MNLDPLSFALSYISYSVSSLTKKNFKSSVQEISRLVALHGFEAERHLLRCLFSHVDFSGDGKSSGKDFHQTQYLIQEFSSVLSKPNFVSTVCFAIENPLHHQKSLRPSPLLLPHISRVLRLNRVQEVVLGTCLLHSSSADLCNCATQFIRLKLPDLLRSYTDSDSSTQEGDLQDCSPEVLHLLLVELLNKNSEHFGVTNELKESFFENLRKDFPQDRVPVVLAPLLYGEASDVLMVKGMTEPASNMSKPMELSHVDLIKEVGYGFTASVEECRQSLIQMGLRDPGPCMVARVLSMMANTHTGLSEPLQGLGPSATSPWGADKDANTSHVTWNIDIFIQALYDLVPTLNWKEVVGELDFPGFFVKDRQGLKLLWHGLCRGLGSEPFPTDRLYRVWRNPDSQLSLFHQIMKNSDIVCLTDYKYRPVSMEILKALPEDDNRDIANWKSLDLVETLLNLSDKVQYSSHVHDLFKYPVQHCPDLLMLGLLQASGPMQGFRQELLTNLVFVFLSNHPNSAIVLQAAWNVQSHANVVRPLIMHTMADWYMRGGESEQGRLSRILDVAQDLKALSVLLSSNSFPLVIDLACLASRREYLKLDKWLTDKIFEHKEAFIQACVNFLKRRCPQIMGGIVKEENLPKSAQLPAETLATMLSCLQQYAGSVSQELSETILTMSGNCSILLNKPRQPPPGVVKTPRGLEPAFSAASLNPSQAPQQQQQQQQMPTSASVPITLNSSITISPVTADKSRPAPVSGLPRPPPLAPGVQIIPQPAPKVIMLDSAAARAAALQHQQMRRVSGSRDGTPPSTSRLPSHLVAGNASSGSGSPRLPETSVLERNSAITITPVGAGPSSTSSSSSSRTASPSVSVVRIKEEPKSPGEQQLPSCSGDAGPSSNTLRSSASPAETAAGLASRSLNDFANRSIGNLLQSTGSKDTSQEKGAQGGQPQADSSCSPSSIAEPVCSSSSRTASTVSASTANSTTVTAQGSGGVQDCFEDLSTLEELLKIGDKSFDLPAQDASSSSSSTMAVATSNGPTAASNGSSAAQASPSSRTPPIQNSGGGDTANGTGLKIVETHSLQSSDPNEDWCSVCHDGGELLCCGSCPRVYHLQCHVPSLGATPSEDWTCLLCLDILKCNIPRESAGSKRKTPVGLSGRELLICERILLHLFCHELSVPFHIPVSRTVPNYYKVITKPMDLTTIKQKLSPSHFNHYEDVPEFLADVKLIFKNCYTFNHVKSGKESQVCQQARTLERDFDALVQQFLPEHYAELRDAQPDPQPGYESDPERRKRARTSSTSSSPPEQAVVLS
uniref:CCR4-NOT transcription complex subunit 1 n=1 Tax=Rhipicephalus appendiculatus TaxID=34631 RepID=A0A131YE57_RHIAP